MPRTSQKNSPQPSKKVDTKKGEIKKTIKRKRNVDPRVHAKSTPASDFSRSLVLLLPVVFVLYFGISFVFDMMSNKPAIRGYCLDTEKFIVQNATTFPHLFTTWFDEAKACNGDLVCREEIQSRIMTSLDGKEDLQFFESTYFIRAKSNTEIEKLFLSGEWKMVTVSKNEKKLQKVLALLQGRHRKICDQGFKVDSEQGNMKYLHDLWAEAEIIIPVKDDGKVIGAIVKAWGD